MLSLGDYQFGWGINRTRRVRYGETRAGYILQGRPYKGGFKFGKGNVSSSEFGVFEVGGGVIGVADITLDFPDGTK